jgi:DNA polymerase-3 subunit epsilon
MTFFNWFKKNNKSDPEFCQSYLSNFDPKFKNTLEQRAVAFDTETTGLDF